MKEFFRVNHQIRVRQVRLIDESGLQLGVVPTDEARKIALERGYDLVEVASEAAPPVCKLLDFGKFKYSQKKKEHKTKQKQHVIKVKEIRLRPITGRHDIDVKLNQARKFIEKGDKVLFNMLFRGRELAHREIGGEIFNSICKDLENVAKIESPAKMEGRKLLMVLAPK